MVRTIVTLTALLVAGALALADEEEPQGVGVGAPAPAFRLNDQDGKAVDLRAYGREAWTIVAYFPKAATPG